MTRSPRPCAVAPHDPAEHRQEHHGWPKAEGQGAGVAEDDGAGRLGPVTDQLQAVQQPAGQVRFAERRLPLILRLDQGPQVGEVVLGGLDVLGHGAISGRASEGS